MESSSFIVRYFTRVIYFIIKRLIIYFPNRRYNGYDKTWLHKIYFTD